MAECSSHNPGSEMCEFFEDEVFDTHESTDHEIASTSCGVRVGYQMDIPESACGYRSLTLKELAAGFRSGGESLLCSNSKFTNPSQNCPISNLIEKMDQESESENELNMKATKCTRERVFKNIEGKHKIRKNTRILKQFLSRDDREIDRVTLKNWGALMTDIRKVSKRNRSLRRASHVKRRRKNATVSRENSNSNPVSNEQTTVNHINAAERQNSSTDHSDNDRWERLQLLLLQDDITVDETVANNWMSLMNGIRKGSSTLQRRLTSSHLDPNIEVDLEGDRNSPLDDLQGIDLHDIDFHDFINLEWPDDELGILTGQVGAQAIEERYPKGEVVEKECYICYELKEVALRICCGTPVCDSCMDMYLKTQVQDAVVKIECLNLECDSYVHRDEVFARLPVELKSKYYKFLIDANKDPHVKTCPRCNHVRKIRKDELTVGKKIQKRGLQVTCDICQLAWCFTCHAPWHEGITCKQFLKGDKLVRHWAKEQHYGQRNAQKCPKCKVFIERIQGCDHMTCSKCSSEFCYRCGERYFTDVTRILGNHHSKFSPFGCKYNLLPDRPVARRCVRGAVASGKVLGTIVVAGLAVAAGAGLLGLGVIALPVYCCHKSFKKRKRNRARRRRELWATPRMNLDYLDITDAVQVPESVENGESSETSRSWSDFSSSSGGYSDSDSVRSAESDSLSSLWMESTERDKEKTNVSVGNVDITLKGDDKQIATVVEKQERNNESEYPEIILNVRSSYKDCPVLEPSEYLTNVNPDTIDRKNTPQNSGKSDMRVSSIGENSDGSGSECGYRLSFDKKFRVILDNIHAKVKENQVQVESLLNKMATVDDDKHTVINQKIDDPESFRYIDEEEINQKSSDETERNEYLGEMSDSVGALSKINNSPDLPNDDSSVIKNNIHVSEIDDKCSPGCFVNILKSDSSKHRYSTSSNDMDGQDVNHDTCAVQGCFVNLFSKRLSLQSKDGDKTHLKKDLPKQGDVKTSDSYIIQSDPEDNKDIGTVCSEKIFNKGESQTEGINTLLGNSITETYL